MLLKFLYGKVILCVPYLPKQSSPRLVISLSSSSSLNLILWARISPLTISGVDSSSLLLYIHFPLKAKAQQLFSLLSPIYPLCILHSVLNIHPKSSSLFLSVVIRYPDDDAQPAAELPEHDGCAAAPKPWSAQFPEGRHGRTNAKHNGPVPTDAIISGMDDLSLT